MPQGLDRHRSAVEERLPVIGHVALALVEIVEQLFAILDDVHRV